MVAGVHGRPEQALVLRVAPAQVPKARLLVEQGCEIIFQDDGGREYTAKVAAFASWSDQHLKAPKANADSALAPHLRYGAGPLETEALHAVPEGMVLPTHVHVKIRKGDQPVADCTALQDTQGKQLQ